MDRGWLPGPTTAERDRTTGEIGIANAGLTATKADLLVNLRYLKKTAETCEVIVKTWDRRFNARAYGCSAYVLAFAIITGDVKGHTSSGTVRFAQHSVRVKLVHQLAAIPQTIELIEAEAEAVEGAPSFLLKRSVVFPIHEKQHS